MVSCLPSLVDQDPAARADAGLAGDGAHRAAGGVVGEGHRGRGPPARPLALQGGGRAVVDQPTGGVTLVGPLLPVVRVVRQDQQRGVEDECELLGRIRQLHDARLGEGHQAGRLRLLVSVEGGGLAPHRDVLGEQVAVLLHHLGADLPRHRERGDTAGQACVLGDHHHGPVAGHRAVPVGREVRRSTTGRGRGGVTGGVDRAEHEGDGQERHRARRDPGPAPGRRGVCGRRRDQPCPMSEASIAPYSLTSAGVRSSSPGLKSPVAVIPTPSWRTR